MKELTVKTSNRNLTLKCESTCDFIDLLYSLSLAKKRSVYTNPNRHGSFAPVRNEGTKCKFLIDGKNYYIEVYNAIKNAKKEIFIADWWFYPKLYLTRPGTDESRIDNLLLKKAKEGV